MAHAPDPLYTCLHHPDGGACRFFDEERMSSLIRKWQQIGQEDLFRDIVEGSLDLIQTVIRKDRFDRYDEVDALTNDCVLKLRKALPKYHATRGRAFSLLTVVLEQYLVSRAQRIGVRTKYVTSQEPELLEDWIINGVAPNEHFSQFWPLLQKLRTRFQEPDLLEIQRRIVTYILSRDGRPWYNGHGRLLAQLFEDYRAAHPQMTRGERGRIRERLPVLYNYIQSVPEMVISRASHAAGQHIATT
jgi:hypothetical protein